VRALNSSFDFSNPVRKPPIDFCATFAEMDLSMAVWTDSCHPSRVVRTAIRQPSNMMRLKIWCAVPPLEGRVNITGFTFTIRTG